MHKPQATLPPLRRLRVITYRVTLDVPLPLVIKVPNLLPTNEPSYQPFRQQTYGGWRRGRCPQRAETTRPYLRSSGDQNLTKIEMNRNWSGTLIRLEQGRRLTTREVVEQLSGGVNKRGTFHALVRQAQGSRRDRAPGGSPGARSATESSWISRRASEGVCGRPHRAAVSTSYRR